MSKQATRLFSFLAVLLIALVLVVGCSSGDPQASSSVPAAEEGTGALQSAPPATDAKASAQASDAGAVTAQPSAAAVSDKPVAASDKESAAAETKPAVTPSPASGSGNTVSASKASPEADGADGSSSSAEGSAPSPAATQPTVTDKPTSTVKPAASVQPAASVKPAEHAATTGTATISVVGDKEVGVILSPTSVNVEEGDSVLDLLKRITRANKMQMEFSGAKGFSYIEGIDNLYEFDHGPESGWMYRVNGEFSSKSAGVYIVNPGDTIDWLYTLDLGKDLGAKAP